ncbi:MAG: hypothetical protein ACFFAN_01880 [Promethearchaeota archaeon]
MSELAEDIRNKMVLILKEEEEKTDLDNLAVLSKVGMKVASSTSAELDADTTSASSTALIDLGLRLSEATNHGSLKEIILHNNAGYSILMAINDNYIVFGGLTAIYRIGYYLGYLSELAKKLNILISGGEISAMALSMQESELERLRKEQEEAELKATMPVTPSIEQDKAAMDELLGFLDDWDREEKEAMGIADFEDLESDNIVSIPESMLIGAPKTRKVREISEDSFQEIEQESDSQFKLYKDEVPPVPLDDYTPIDVEEQPSQATEYDIPAEVNNEAYLYKPLEENESKELSSFQELPSFDELSTPNFGTQNIASEYDTEFILEEESETLDKVLKDLGWEEED